MRAKVYVTLKPGVLDPQGKAIQHSVGLLGFDRIRDVRQGKYFEIALDDGVDEAGARAQAEAIRRLTSLPATNLGLDHRGLLRPGMFADVVVFDPAQVADRATFERPHQYAVGFAHVLVNGVPVLRDGEHTGATPGRALWGPGKVK